MRHGQGSMLRVDDEGLTILRLGGSRRRVAGVTHAQIPFQLFHRVIVKYLGDETHPFVDVEPLGVLSFRGYDPGALLTPGKQRIPLFIVSS